MKRFLFLTYHFAPIGGVGTQRQHQFVRFLEDYGWQATVIACRPHGSLPYDEKLLAQLPKSTTVLRARPFEFDLPQRAAWRLGLNRFASFLVGLYFPDPAWGWAAEAYRLGLRASKETRLDAVVSSGPPHSAHLAAKRLAKKLDLPFVVDYRDEWSDNPYVRHATPLHRSATEKLEQGVLNAANTVLTPTSVCTARVARRAGPGKVVTITNGYPEEQFTNTQPYNGGMKFTIAYVGTVYGMNQPTILFSALRKLIDENRIPLEKVRFLHVGIGGYTIPAEIAPLVERRGFVPHSEAVSIMCGADLLTLTLPDPAPLSGKIFEYLRSGRPVLAITPVDGALGNLVGEAGAGDAVDPQNISGIADAIESHFRSWERGEKRVGANFEKIQKYDWRRLTSEFASVLDQALKSDGMTAVE